MTNSGLIRDTYGGDDPGDVGLCCCEYVDAAGRKAHLCQLCCDCAELDDAVDRLVSGRQVPDGRAAEIWRVVEDRARIPWRGGAIKELIKHVLRPDQPPMSKSTR